MQAELSVETGRRLPPSFDLRVGQRVAMMCIGYVPLLHALLSIGIASVVLQTFGPGWACVGLVGAVYLIPPLAVVAARPRVYLSNARIAVGTDGFLRWWYTAQWQVVFNRFPQLEELLRLVPGLYSSWLRMWGARVGRLVYWSPGVTVFDRSFLEIGDRVVIGADTKLSPHFLARGRAGVTELVLAPISIGHDAMIGGSTLLPAGVRVDACEQTPGGRPMAPFSRYTNGRHTRTIRFHEGLENEL
jgi:hypothetical protein